MESELAAIQSRLNSRMHRNEVKTSSEITTVEREIKHLEDKIADFTKDDEIKNNDWCINSKWNFKGGLRTNGKSIKNAVKENAPTYTYSRFCKDWKETTGLNTMIGRSGWSCISDYKQYQYAGMSTGSIYVLKDFSSSWIEIPTYNNPWTGVASNGDGSQAVFCDENGNMLFTEDHGDTWGYNTSCANVNAQWCSICYVDGFFYMSYYDQTTGSQNAILKITINSGVLSLVGVLNLSYTSPTITNKVTQIRSNSSLSLLFIAVEDVGVFTVSPSDTTTLTKIISGSHNWYDISTYYNTLMVISKDNDCGKCLISTNLNDLDNIKFITVNFDEVPQSCFITDTYSYITFSNNNVKRSNDFYTWNNIDEFGGKNMAPMVINGNTNGRDINVITNYGVIYKTGNNGDSWSIDNNIYTSNVGDLNFISNGSSKCKALFYLNIGVMIFANTLYVTKNGGKLWNQVFNVGFINVYNDIVMSSDGSLFFVCGDGCLLVSRDGATTWNYIFNNNITYRTINKLDDFTYILTTYDSKCYMTQDAGLTWTLFNTISDTYRVIDSIQNNVDIYYLLTDSTPNSTMSRIYKFNRGFELIAGQIPANDLKGMISSFGLYYVYSSSEIYQVSISGGIGTLVPFFSVPIQKSIISCYLSPTNTIVIVGTDGLLYTSLFVSGEYLPPTSNINVPNIEVNNLYVAYNTPKYFLITSDMSVYTYTDISTGTYLQTASEYSVFSKANTFLPCLSQSGTGDVVAISSPLTHALGLSFNEGRTFMYDDTLPSLPWISTKVSKDGNTIILCSLPIDVGGTMHSFVYITRDRGNKWSIIEELPSNALWLDCAISPSGDNVALLQFVPGNDGVVFYSSDAAYCFKSFDLSTVDKSESLFSFPMISIPFQVLITDNDIIRVVYLNGYILGTDDFGYEWKEIYNSNALQLYASMSDDGKYIDIPIMAFTIEDLEELGGINLGVISNGSIIGLMNVLGMVLRSTVIKSCTYGYSFDVCKDINTSDLILSCCVSPNGQYHVVPYFGKVYVSENYAGSFLQNSTVTSGLMIKCVMNENCSIVKTINLTGMIFESRNKQSNMSSDYDLPVRVSGTYFLPNGQDDCSTFIAVSSKSGSTTITLPKISEMYPTQKRKYTFFDCDLAFTDNNFTLKTKGSDLLIISRSYSNAGYDSYPFDGGVKIIEVISDCNGYWYAIC